MSNPLESTFKNTYEKNRSFLDDLVQRILAQPDSIIPFIGAGFSVPTGMPGWERFLRALIEMGRNANLLTPEWESTLKACLDQGNFEAVADHLWTELGDTTFINKLQQEFRLRRRPILGAVRHVPSFAGSAVITTNFDQIIETVWDHFLINNGEGERCIPLMSTNPDDLRRMRIDSGRWLLKLHGDVDKPASWIIKQQDYKDTYDREGATLPDVLRRLFEKHTPLFLGCSLHEQRIITELKRARRTGFALLAATSAAEDQRVASSLRDVVNIIWLRREDVGTGSPYDLLDPLLEWIGRRVRVGPVSLGISGPAFSWDPMLQRFKDSGDFAEAIEWITSNWLAHKSWPFGIRLLEFYDLLGDGKRGLDNFFGAAGGRRASLTRIPDKPLAEHAENYYKGRLFGHEGSMEQALAEHRQNITTNYGSDIYQVRSRFEIGQLSFRVEDFDVATEQFLDIWSLGEELTSEPRLLVDVLKFLVTLQVRGVILASHVPICYAGDATKALERADIAQRYAEREDYHDGIAWSHAVRAFALEALRVLPEAREAYAKALRISKDSRCRRSSQAHIRIYLAGFLRRCRDFPGARSELDDAWKQVPAPTRIRDFAKIAEERSHVEADEGNNGKARDEFQKALRLYAKDPTFKYSSRYPIVARLRTMCEERSIDFKRFVK